MKLLDELMKLVEKVNRAFAPPPLPPPEERDPARWRDALREADARLSAYLARRRRQGTARPNYPGVRSTQEQRVRASLQPPTGYDGLVQERAEGIYRQRSPELLSAAAEIRRQAQAEVQRLTQLLRKHQLALRGLLGSNWAGLIDSYVHSLTDSSFAHDWVRVGLLDALRACRRSAGKGALPRPDHQRTGGEATEIPTPRGMRLPSEDRERRRERAGYVTGTTRALERTARLEEKGHGSLTAGGRKTIRQVCGALATQIGSRLEAEGAKKGGRPTGWYRLLKGIDPAALAWRTLRVTLDKVLWSGYGDAEPDEDDGGADPAVHRPARAARASRQGLACAIGRQVETEAQLVAFKAKATGEVRAACKALEKTYSGVEQRSKLAQLMRRHGFRWSDWTDKENGEAGLFCLQCLEKAEPELIQWVRGRKGMHCARLHPRAKKVIDTANEEYAEMSALHFPMLWSPRPWTNVHEGAYLDNELTGVRLIKSHHEDQLQGIDPARMPIVFCAVNAVQGVAWRVNGRLLNVMKTLFGQGGQSGLFGSDTRQAEAALETATLHARESRLWLPASLDYRGRLYYVPHFNPHGPDYTRALLEFADGEALTEAAQLLPLMAHGAALYGEADTRDLLKLADWTAEHLGDVRASARTPEGSEWWRRAESRWRFLRWCIEMERIPDAWVTNPMKFSPSDCKPLHMPLYIDARCSGIQHLALLLGNRQLAAMVGLHSGLLPAQDTDIYTAVASKVAKLVEEEANKGASPWARRWREYGIDRNLVKKCVMTLGCGATNRARERAIIEAVQKRSGTGRRHPFGSQEGLKKAVSWLAPRVLAAMADMGLKELQDWLRKVARRLAGARPSPGHAEWVSPSGFPVRQREFCTEPVNLNRRAPDGQRLQCQIRVSTRRIDPRKAATKITPNFIHSLDAALLHIAVGNCRSRGISSLAVVHDAFATHPGRYFDLRKALDDGLNQMYFWWPDFSRQGLLDVYWGVFQQQLPAGAAPLDRPPSCGDLSISGGIRSDYAFL